MFVLTVDQIGSRRGPDRAGSAIERLSRTAPSGGLLLPPERTAGDEFQVMTADPAVVLGIVLDLNREGHWSIGVGCGDVERPIPESVRAGRGAAFVAARRAVDRAKTLRPRFALEAEGDSLGRSALDARGVEAVVALLLLLRERRSAEGWEAVDLVERGLRQNQAAELLGVSAAAISTRLRAAGWKNEIAARPAIVALLADLDGGDGGVEP